MTYFSSNKQVLKIVAASYIVYYKNIRVPLTVRSSLTILKHFITRINHYLLFKNIMTIIIIIKFQHYININ